MGNLTVERSARDQRELIRARFLSFRLIAFKRDYQCSVYNFHVLHPLMCLPFIMYIFHSLLRHFSFFLLPFENLFLIRAGERNQQTAARLKRARFLHVSLARSQCFRRASKTKTCFAACAVPFRQRLTRNYSEFIFSCNKL